MVTTGKTLIYVHITDMLETSLNKQKYDFDHASFKRSQDWFQPNFKSNQRFFLLMHILKNYWQTALLLGQKRRNCLHFNAKKIHYFSGHTVWVTV